MKRQDIIEIFGSGIREMAYELCTRAGLKEMIRALPEGMVLSVALEKEGGDGDKKGFQA